MIKKFLDIFRNLETETIKIIKIGLKCCFMISIISIILLLIYDFLFAAPSLFNIGLTLFKLSLLFSVEFLICGIVVDGLKKHII